MRQTLTYNILLSAKDQAYILASFTIMHSTVHVAKVAHPFS